MAEAVPRVDLRDALFLIGQVDAHSRRPLLTVKAFQNLLTIYAEVGERACAVSRLALRDDGTWQAQRAVPLGGWEPMYSGVAFDEMARSLVADASNRAATAASRAGESLEIETRSETGPALI